MSSSPHQTYLSERLQSARWLGWDIGKHESDLSETRRHSWARVALLNLLRRLHFA